MRFSVHTSAIVAVLHIFFLVGSEYKKAAHMEQKLGELQWQSVLCLMLTSDGERRGRHILRQTLRFPSHIDILTHLFVPAAHTYRFLLQNWLLPPRNGPGELGENILLENTKHRCLQKHQAFMSHLCKAVNASSDGCEYFCTLQASNFH